MLSLTASSQTLDIDRNNLKFNITYRNPYFGFLTGAVFNFTIPYTSKNAAVFNFPSRLNRLSKSTATAPGRIVDDGIELAAGTWQAIASGEESIELSFSFIADEIVSVLDGKTLPDIFDQAIEVNSIMDHVAETVLLDYPTTEYNFPSVYAPSFYSNNENFLKVINYFEGTFVKDNPENDGFNQNTIVPMLYLFTIIRRIFSYAGYEVSGSILSDTLLKKAIIFNNYSLDHFVLCNFHGTLNWDYITHMLTLYRVRFDNSMVDEVNTVYDYGTGLLYLSLTDTYNFVLNLRHKPKGSDTTYKLRVYKTIGQTTTTIHSLDGEYNETDEYKDDYIAFSDDVVASTPSPAIIQVVLFSYTGAVASESIVMPGTLLMIHSSITGLPLNVYQNSINLKNHVPPTDCIEFLQHFCNDYQQFIKIDKISKTATLIPIPDLFKSLPYTDLTPGLVRNSLKIKQSEYKGLSLMFDFEYDNIFTPEQHDLTVDDYSQLPALTKPACALVVSLLSYFQNVYDENLEEWVWEFLSYLNPVVEDAEKEEEIKLSFAPLLMTNFVNRNEVNISLPVYNDSGTSHAYKEQNTFPLRIIFYAGMLYGAATEANYYPFASTSKYNALYEPVLPCNYTAAEVTARYWEKTLDWLKERLEIEFERRFTNLELRNLMFEKPSMFLDSKIFLEEVFAQFQPELKTCKLKAWTSP